MGGRLPGPPGAIARQEKAHVSCFHLHSLWELGVEAVHPETVLGSQTRTVHPQRVWAAGTQCRRGGRFRGLLRKFNAEGPASRAMAAVQTHSSPLHPPPRQVPLRPSPGTSTFLFVARGTRQRPTISKEVSADSSGALFLQVGLSHTGGALAQEGPLTDC